MKNFLILLLSFFLFGVSVAATKSDALFLKTMQALERRDKGLYNEYKGKLKNYPLYLYLEYEALLVDLPNARNVKVSRFLDKYKNTPLAKKLREKWLYFLASNDRYKEFLQFYQKSNKKSLQCYYLKALYKENYKTKALNQVQKIWLQGKSLPDACNYIFNIWEKRQLTADLLWQRFKLAIASKQKGLAKFLTTKMNATDRKIAKDVLDIYNNPLNLYHYQFKKTTKARDMIFYGIKKLALDKPTDAISLWHKFQGQQNFTFKQKNEIYYQISLGLATEKNQDAFYWFNKISNQFVDNTLRAWLIRLSLFHRNWLTVKDIIVNMPKDEKQNPAWRYWLARSYQMLGNQNHAKKIYKKLIEERHFYAILSAIQIEYDYKPKDEAKEINFNQFKKVTNHPGIIRATKLFQFAYYSYARIEWNYALNQLNQEQKYLAAIYAYQIGWYEKAIHASIASKHLDDLSIRFPLAHEKLVINVANQYQQDPAIIFAIMRQESAFMHDAKSAVGALGMMQLMPATARESADKYQIPYQNEYDLLNVQTNLKIGNAHFNEVLQKYDNNLVYALAAYNAGSRHVSKWLKGAQNEATDIWIETIPFKETRNYVKNILTYYVIYQYQLGRKSFILDDF